MQATVERTSALEVAKEATLRRIGRLRQMKRDFTATESTERDLVVAAAKAQQAPDHQIGAATTGATVALLLLTRQQDVSSRSKQPGYDSSITAAWHVPSFMAEARDLLHVGGLGGGNGLRSSGVD